jgi:hypothetical protein
MKSEAVRPLAGQSNQEVYRTIWREVNLKLLTWITLRTSVKSLGVSEWVPRFQRAADCALKLASINEL